MRKKIIIVIGARPQFIKHAPVEFELTKDFDIVTIHTGQHYDDNMSKIFFDELKLVKPKYLLSLGNLSHGKQTGKMLTEIEKIILKETPDALLVYGDTNSTLAGALVGAKLNIPIFHIEAGLRSYNKEMPEEINRVLTDHISTLLFTTSLTANENLKAEGITDGVYEVGDVMYDILKLSLNKNLIHKNGENDYYYCTLHRPYNVDKKNRLTYILDKLNALNNKVIFPIHPRTENKIESFGLKKEYYPNIKFINAQSYFDNLGYLKYSKGLITDSGGMQKEAYWLKIKCVTIRTETEWVETLQNKWNTLVFDNLDELSSILKEPSGVYIDNIYGNGQSAKNIKKYLNNYFSN